MLPERETPTSAVSSSGLRAAAQRERTQDAYWARDPINEARMWWRAQTVRHLFHVLPGETFLELGCGSGRLSQALLGVTRRECPLTAATFCRGGHEAALRTLEEPTEVVTLDEFPGPLRGRSFDYLVATNLLDTEHGAEFLQVAYQLLKPGGRMLFFEINPWNPAFRLRRWVTGWLPFLRRGDEEPLPNQIQLYELLSELGFVRISVNSYDFLYRPLPRWLMFPVRHLTLLLENTPGVRRLAGTIVLHAQRPPRDQPRVAVSLTEHASLRATVSVVIPCRNEARNVGPLVEGLLRHYDDYLHEIVLVDDSSTDGTPGVLAELAAREPRVRPVFRAPPNGVGRALRDGLAAARGRYVLLMDCDFLHILPELREMFDAAAKGADVVIGSRFSRSSVLVNYPLAKIISNRTFHVLASLLLRRRIRDVTNNLKLLTREVVEYLDIETPNFAANAETGLKPLLMGFRVEGVPISWINRTPEMGQSSFSLLGSGAGYARVLGTLLWRTRFGFRTLPRIPVPGRDLRPAMT